MTTQDLRLDKVLSEKQLRTLRAALSLYAQNLNDCTTETALESLRNLINAADVKHTLFSDAQATYYAIESEIELFNAAA